MKLDVLAHAQNSLGISYFTIKYSHDREMQLLEVMFHTGLVLTMDLPVGRAIGFIQQDINKYLNNFPRSVSIQPSTVKFVWRCITEVASDGTHIIAVNPHSHALAQLWKQRQFEIFVDVEIRRMYDGNLPLEAVLHAIYSFYGVPYNESQERIGRILQSGKVNDQ